MHLSPQVKEEQYDVEDFAMENEEHWELKPDLDYWQDDTAEEKAPRGLIQLKKNHLRNPQENRKSQV